MTRATGRSTDPRAVPPRTALLGERSPDGETDEDTGLPLTRSILPRSEYSPEMVARWSARLEIEEATFRRLAGYS